MIVNNWIEKEKHSDGTTTCECPDCGHSWRFSIYTFIGFKFCPNCGKAIVFQDRTSSNRFFEDFVDMMFQEVIK